MAQKQPARRTNLIHGTCRSMHAAAGSFCFALIFFGTLLDSFSKPCYHNNNLF